MFLLLPGAEIWQNYQDFCHQSSRQTSVAHLEKLSSPRVLLSPCHGTEMAGAEKSKNKCRQHSMDLHQQLPVCPIQEQAFPHEAGNPSGLTAPKEEAHPGKAGKASVMYFKGSQHFQVILRNTRLIDGSGKPHTIGEQLIPPTASHILPKSPHNIMKTIPLSIPGAQRSMDDKAEPAENTLRSTLGQASLLYC